MNVKNGLMAAVVVASAACWVQGAAAAQSLFTRVPVFSIIVTESDFGGCMAKIPNSVDFDGAGLSGCRAGNVSFGCTGDQQPKSVALQMLAAAQLAYVSGSTLNIRVTDTVKYNGFCMANRVDNAPQ